MCSVAHNPYRARARSARHGFDRNVSHHVASGERSHRELNLVGVRIALEGNSLRNLPPPGFESRHHIGHAVREEERREAAHDAVSKMPEKRLASFPPNRRFCKATSEHNIGRSVRERGEQERNLLWRELQVRIHLHDDVAGERCNADARRVPLPAIVLIPQIAEARKSFLETRNDLASSIRTPVNDEDLRVRTLIEHSGQAARNVFLFIQSRNKDRNVHRIRGPLLKRNDMNRSISTNEAETPVPSLAPVWLLIAILIAATLVAFAPVAHFEFINLDDPDYVTENAAVLAGLQLESIRWAFTNFHSGHWHPLTWISHMSDIELFGLERPGAHHLVNVALHLANVLLFFLLARRTTGRTNSSFFAALVFALHPMRIESVAWVAERKDVLSVFFGLLAMSAYIRFAAQRNLLAYLAVFWAFALSLLSKPTFVTLPVLLLLLDYWPLHRVPAVGAGAAKRFAALIFEKLPFFALSLGSSIVTVLAQDAGGALGGMSAYTFDARLANVFVSYQAYLGKFFFPLHLGIFYPFQVYAPGVGCGAFIGLLAVTACVCRVRATHPYVVFSWLWFLVSLLPMIGIIQFGGQAFADRWSYMPHLGLAWGLSMLGANRLAFRRSAAKLLGALVVTLLVCATRYQLQFWSDSETLFRHTIEVSPENFLAADNLGVALDRKGAMAEAKALFETAVRLRPGYAPALNNLGTILAREGDVRQAQGYFMRALASDPHSISARYHLGLTFADTNQIGEALAEWAVVLRQEPGFQRARQSILALSSRLKDCPAGFSQLAPERREAIRGILEHWPVESERSAVMPLARCAGAGAGE